MPDTSLGAETSVVNGLAAQPQQEIISGGAARGTVLFHSFQDLNVGEGRSLYFANPIGIRQIFSRVTGRNPSNILGTLGVLGNADLFLLNPNGILFGLNAQLNLSGSFVATTGDRFTFADGTTFSAKNPESKALLTISQPTGLQMGTTPGSIVNQSIANGSGLTIQPQQTLALIGGDLSFDGGRITADSGQIQLASLENQSIELIPNGNGFGFGIPTTGTGGTIDLRNRAVITLQTRLKNPDSQIHLVGDLLKLQDQSEIRTINLSDTAGSEIDIQAHDLQLSSGGRVLTVANAGGAGGEIHGAIANQIVIEGDNPVIPTDLSGFYSFSLGAGTGGNITLETGKLTLPLSGVVFTDTQGTGRGGSIAIMAAQSIESTSISPRFPGLGGVILALTTSAAPGGDVTINTANLTLTGGAAIQTATALGGAAGNLKLQVADRVTLSGVNPFVPLFPSGLIAPTYGAGAGGDITLTTRELLIEDGGSLLTTVLPREAIGVLNGNPRFANQPDSGAGKAGNIWVQADAIAIRGINTLFAAESLPSQLSSLTFVSGNAGNVSVSARDIRVEAGGLLGSSSVLGIAPLPPSTPAFFRGDGGDVTIEAESIVVDGVNAQTGLSSILGTQTVGQGASGDTRIDTGTLRVSHGGQVSASTIAFGNAGNLVVNARAGIEITGVNANGQASTLGTDATPASPSVRQALFLPAVPMGDTGTLRITTPQLRIRDGGTVGVQHFGTGNAGQLHVMANQLILDQGGRLTAATLSGNGGEIDLQIRDLLLLRRGSQITAEAFGGQGDGGNLQIDAGTIVAVPQENSDIVANAAGGQGGRITLRTARLFGIEFRDRLTPASNITASSGIGLDGVVQINQLVTTDPSLGVTGLPMGFANESQQISTGCDRIGQSSFIRSGRGGLPPDPRQTSPAAGGLQDWREREDLIDLAPGKLPSPAAQRGVDAFSGRGAIAKGEATRLQVAADQTIRLVAGAPKTGSMMTGARANCHPTSFGAKHP